jgi:hypothetical protein
MSRQLESWIDGFMELTDNTEPPPVYRRWVAISTIASVLQRKCWLDWGMETFYPNMFIVIIGTPATRKGTALKIGKVFLDKLGIRVSADESSRQAIIRALMEAEATATARDGKPVYHSSLTVFSSELTVFLGYENMELLAMLCKLYDCESHFVYDTVKRGREEIQNVWLNLIGATTPAQLQAAVPQGFIGSGFTSRVVFVYANQKGKVVIKPTLSPEQKIISEKLLSDLGVIHTITGPFTTTDDFDDLYGRWRIDAETHPPFKDNRLEYYTQRRPTHIFKLSMIYAASRGGSLELTRPDLENAINTLEEAERVMPAVFSGIGANPLAGVQTRMQQMIKEAGRLPMSDIAEAFAADATHSQIGESLASLEQRGLIQIDVVNKLILFRGR